MTPGLLLEKLKKIDSSFFPIVFGSREICEIKEAQNSFFLEF